MIGTSLRMPCDCDREANPHRAYCRRRAADSALQQREAVGEMFDELEVLWRLKHGTRPETAAVRCGKCGADAGNGVMLTATERRCRACFLAGEAA